MGTSKLIHYTLSCDLKCRDGKWVRHLSATYDGIERRVTTRLGTLWNNVLQRTRDGSSFQVRKPTYRGVSNLFSSFEDFCDFCVNCPGFGRYDDHGRIYSLDKDILGDGTHYSREACCFVPLRINNLFLERGGVKKRDLPPGITMHGSKYRVRDSVGNGHHLFPDLDSAISKKKELKRERIILSIPLVSYDSRIVEEFNRRVYGISNG